MMISLLFALQAVSPPDIELRATVRARELAISKAGAAQVSVTANGQNVVSVEGPKANGRKRVRNPVFNVNIEARIADPRDAPQGELPPSD